MMRMYKIVLCHKKCCFCLSTYCHKNIYTNLLVINDKKRQAGIAQWYRERCCAHGWGSTLGRGFQSVLLGGNVGPSSSVAVPQHVVSEVDLRESTLHSSPQCKQDRTHSCFETQKRHHQKSNTGVHPTRTCACVHQKKALMITSPIFKYNRIYSHINFDGWAGSPNLHKNIASHFKRNTLKRIPP